MLGLQMSLNGTIGMEMEEAIIQEELPPMFARTFLGLHWAQQLEEIDGVVMIPMVMAGPTKETNSRTNLPNGET